MYFKTLHSINFHISNKLLIKEQSNAKLVSLNFFTVNIRPDREYVQATMAAAQAFCGVSMSLLPPLKRSHLVLLPPNMLSALESK